MTHHHIQWQQHTCLLTGATGGIGQALAFALAEKGVKLLLVGRNVSKLHRLQQELPGEHRYIAADLTSETGLISIVEQAAEQGVSMLVHNAGINMMGELRFQPEGKIRHLMNVNLTTPMVLTSYLLPILLRHAQPRVMTIGSTFGSIGYACHAAYCASKFGLRGFSEALAREYQDTALRVHYIAPRATDTDMNSAVINAMNTALGNQSDSPQWVARQVVQQIEAGQARRFLGFPEKLFVRINALLPSLVDKALAKKLSIVKQFAKREEAL